MKNNSKTSKKAVLTFGITAAVATFLLLPVFFSDEPSSVLLHSEEEGSGVLPVIASENPLSKYLRQASSFYGFNKEKDAFGKGKGMLPPAPQESYSEAQQDAMLAAFAKEKMDREAAEQAYAAAAEAAAAKNAANTYYAQDGVTVQPDEKGYYYGDKYYKNGTYPNSQLKKSIENSISKFHDAQASKQGKRAVYMLQDDGALLVKYMPKKELDSLQAGAALSAMDKNLYASGRKYGANASPNRSGSTGVQGGDYGSANSRSAANVRYSGSDIAGAYNAAEQIRASAAGQQGQQAADNSQNDDGYAPDNNYYRERPKALLNTLGEFDRKRFLNDGPTYRMDYKEIYNGKNTYVDKELALELQKNLGIDVYQDTRLERGAKVALFDMSRLGDSDYTKNFDKDNADTFRLFTAGYNEGFVKDLLAAGLIPPSQQFGPRNREANNSREGEQNALETTAYMNFLVPARVRGRLENRESEPSYYEVYFQNTRLHDVLTHMNIDKKKVDDIGALYLDLDAEREYDHKVFHEMQEKNPALEDLNPTTVYLLGRQGDNVVVATATSPFYAPHPEMLPEEIYNKYNKDQERGRGAPYVNIPEKEVLDILNKKALSVAVIIDSGKANQAEPVGEYIGRAKVVRVPLEQAASIYPADIKAVNELVRDARLTSAWNVVDYDAKKKLKEDFEGIDKEKTKEEAKKAADAAKKAVDEAAANWNAYLKSGSTMTYKDFLQNQRKGKNLPLSPTQPAATFNGPLTIDYNKYPGLQYNKNMRVNMVTGEPYLAK